MQRCSFYGGLHPVPTHPGQTINSTEKDILQSRNQPVGYKYCRVHAYVH